MLADDIAAAAAAVSRDFHWRKTWNHFAEKIAKAERLVLRRDVVQTAQHLAASRPSSMRDTIEFARPIFPSCWIEWADADKREILELFGLRNMSGSVHPVRVGALITHHEGSDGPGACTIEYAWTHGGPDGVFVCTVAAELALGSLPAEDLEDLELIRQEIRGRKEKEGTYWYIYRNKPAELDAYAELVSRVRMAPAPSAVEDLSAAINSPRLEPRVRDLYESNKVDVDGEALFTISVLLLLNAINATQRQPEDLSRLNRSRQKQRKRPLMGYETVLMRLSRPERTSGGSTGTGHGGPKTAHICRGHYKRLVRPGKAPRLVWWRYHWRGGGPRQSADRTREVTL